MQTILHDHKIKIPSLLFDNCVPKLSQKLNYSEFYQIISIDIAHGVIFWQMQRMFYGLKKGLH